MHFFCILEENANAKNNRGETPLDKARANKNNEVIAFLNQIQSKETKAKEVIHVAAFNNLLGVIAFLLDNEVDINTRDEQGNTALHIAVSCNFKELIEFLLRKGIDLHATNANGETALHTATLCNSLDLVEYLIEKGLDPKAKDKKREKTVSSFIVLYRIRNLNKIFYKSTSKTR